MASRWKCAFCLEAGARSKEHVWPQWLRAAPAVESLLASAHGERFPFEYSDFEVTDGRVSAVPRSVNVARWVPQVTAPVCRSCNSGWMSRLEAKVKRFLGPVVLDGGTGRLSGGEALELARWAVKTSMTYQLALGMKQGCFTPAEMNQMARRQALPSRCKVWVHSLNGPLQFVATQYRGLVMPDAHHVEGLSLRDNLALTLIGIPHLILVVGVAPEANDLWLLDSLLPHGFGTASAPQIWPEPGGLNLPTKGMDPELDPRELFDHLEALGELSPSQLTELSADSLSTLLQNDHRPAAMLHVLIDQFIAECQSEVLREVSVLDALLGGDARLSAEQLGLLFSGALALIREHAETQGREVARRLHNLAHCFFASEAYLACVFLATACGTLPGGGYEKRADIWGLAGHAAWQTGSFGLAAELYEKQLSLDPDSELASFNLAESAFMAGSFENAADILNVLSVDDERPLGDTLVCLRAAVSIIVTELGIASWDGFEGPGLETVMEMVITGEAPNFQNVAAFKEQLLKLLEETRRDVVSVAIARAYVSDSVLDWARAARLLLMEPTRPELKAVLRKGASCGPAFIDALSAELNRQGQPSELPDGTDAVEFARSHAYPKHPRTLRLLDTENQVLRVD